MNDCVALYSALCPSYVLVAISNPGRAAVFRNAVSAAVRLEIVAVRDGDDAVQEIARRGPPALLIIELSLPRVDGFAVIRKIRRQAARDDTRIIAVAAHESLRAAARELAVPLAISTILSLDVDQSALTSLLTADLESSHTPDPAPPSPFVAAQVPDIGDIIDRASIETRRRCRLPISIGYLKIDEEEDLTFHVAARDSGPALAIGEVTAFKFLRQVAETDDPLVIPDVESHPVFAQLLLKGSRPIRGFAAVPVSTSHKNIRAALCVLDTTPIMLTATELDALAAFGRDVGQEIDRVLSAGQLPRAEPTPRASLDVSAEEVKVLQHQAATDPLTGLANRRGGEKHIANEISRVKREQRPLSCILLDIDRFKQVNDTFGHQAGDQLLRDLSNLLRRTVRAYDVLVRWGGEEFLMVMPSVDLDVARVLAERVRTAVEALDTHGIGRVTISAGVARFEQDYDLASTLKTADRRLYQAKAAGRNCVV